jgi:hypothetical protein
MNVLEDALQYRKLQAPRETGGLFCDPAPEEIDATLSENIQRRASDASAVGKAYAEYDCQGRSLQALAKHAREELLRAASSYTSTYRPSASTVTNPAAPLIMTGHQPELFHPGVWCKNFAAARIAERHGGVAIHLIIDSDVCDTRAVRVPGGTVDDPTVQSVGLDTGPVGVPYEEVLVADETTFEEFGATATKILASLVANPIVETFWPLVVSRRTGTEHLGLRLAQGRHLLESRWGLDTLEIPQSKMCQLESFAWFASHLLAQLPRFVEVYNLSLAEYRRNHGVRSAAHPVPDLAMDQRWLEAPFWVWSAQNPIRRRLFVRQQGDKLRLADRNGIELVLNLSPDQSAAEAVREFARVEKTGIKLRPRALVTTMFTRLLLCDLFIHGIGGAKYDQLTDALIDRFFGVSPPRFMTLSGTQRLPIEFMPTTVDRLHELQQRSRRLKYHPEKYFSETSAADVQERDEWVAHKRTWITTPVTPDNARTRHVEIRRSNEALQPWVQTAVRSLRDELEQVRTALRRETILSSREYPFCFLPENILRSYLLDILS